MIELEKDQLVFRFPDVHPDAELRIGFQRTLRHIHVERNENVAKIWLDPVRLHSSGGFPRHEINLLLKMVEENVDVLRRSWDEFFND